GFLVELKPAGVAFHFRSAHPDAAREGLTAVLDGPAAYEGVHVKCGKMVVELSVVPTDKGKALEQIRLRTGSTAARFLGDDFTDEDAFAMLRGPDMGVKVGDGPSRAAFAIPDTEAVARLLASISELRAAWAAGADAAPIERHSTLSDHRTMAVVSPEAR